MVNFSVWWDFIYVQGWSLLEHSIYKWKIMCGKFWKCSFGKSALRSFKLYALEGFSLKLDAAFGLTCLF